MCHTHMHTRSGRLRGNQCEVGVTAPILCASSCNHRNIIIFSFPTETRLQQNIPIYAKRRWMTQKQQRESERNVCLSDCYRQGKLVAVAEATSLSILLFKPFLVSASFSPSVFYYHSDLSLFDAPSLHLCLSLSSRPCLPCIREPLGAIVVLIKASRHVSSARIFCYLRVCKWTVAVHYFWWW